VGHRPLHAAVPHLTTLLTAVYPPPAKPRRSDGRNAPPGLGRSSHARGYQVVLVDVRRRAGAARGFFVTAARGRSPSSASFTRVSASSSGDRRSERRYHW